MNKNILIFAFLLLVVFAGLYCIQLANMSDLSIKLLSPSFCHPFGTDFLGRDMICRTLSGISISLLTGLLTTAISTVLALLFALISASKSRLSSKIVDTLVDLTIGIPHLVLLILITFAFQGGAVGLIAAISLTHWPSLTRILRNEIKSVRSSDYYQIEMHSPNSSFKTSFKQIMPAIIPQLLTGSILTFPHAILHESTLTFLGFGFSPEVPALGVILSESLSYLTIGYWWIGLLPGISLIALVLTIRQLSNCFLKDRNSSDNRQIKLDKLSIKPGELVFLIGESGAGKTSLAEQILENQNPGQTSLIPQALTALDPTKKYELDGKLYYPHELSGGMARRVLIEDSILPNATLLIADEPTNGLDMKASSEIIDRLKNYKNNNCDILIITHELLLAKKFADRILILKDDEIVENSELIEEMLKSAPANIKLPSSVNANNPKTIKLTNVDKSYDDNHVIESFSFTINSTERTCIFGISGSGKTTLSKILAGYIKPDDGILGNNYNIQYVSQNPYSAFNPYIKINGKYPNQYSGGELQKMSVERALKMLPDFIILDEATSMLDLASQKEIFEELTDYCSKNSCGLIFVTHDSALRDRVAERIIQL